MPGRRFLRYCYGDESAPTPVAHLNVGRLLPRNGMLCEKCNQREATIHITEVTIGAGGVSKKTNLCSECSESSGGPDEVRGLAAAWKNARCRHCGGEPSSGGHDPIAGLRGIRTMSFMCKSCAEEYHRFLRQKWPGFGDVTITDEQIAAIHATDKPAVFRDAEEHMKKWVAKRRS